MGYHLADYERWNKLDFVVGIEITRSKSAKGPCPICDAMVGVYPKMFKFISNHPWCICVCTPIMLKGEEYTDYLLTGKVPESRIIKTIPQSAINYVRGSKSMQNSLIIKENAAFFSGATNNTVKLRQKELKEWATSNLKGKSITVGNFAKTILVTNTGIKEFLNQPHKHWAEKNELITNIQSTLNNSSYLGYSDYHKQNEMIKYSHVFEIELKGDKSGQLHSSVAQLTKDTTQPVNKELEISHSV